MAMNVRIKPNQNMRIVHTVSTALIEKTIWSDTLWPCIRFPLKFLNAVTSFSNQRHCYVNMCSLTIDLDIPVGFANEISVEKLFSGDICRFTTDGKTFVVLIVPMPRVIRATWKDIKGSTVDRTVLANPRKRGIFLTRKWFLNLLFNPPEVFAKNSIVKQISAKCTQKLLQNIIIFWTAVKTLQKMWYLRNAMNRNENRIYKTGIMLKTIIRIEQGHVFLNMFKIRRRLMIRFGPRQNGW